MIELKMYVETNDERIIKIPFEIPTILPFVEEN